jgi:hypothetical protein
LTGVAPLWGGGGGRASGAPHEPNRPTHTQPPTDLQVQLVVQLALQVGQPLRGLGRTATVGPAAAVPPPRFLWGRAGTQVGRGRAGERAGGKWGLGVRLACRAPRMRGTK